MAEGINVRISGKLRSFVEAQIGENGLYESVSEYIRSLIRQDFEKEENTRWEWLEEELLPGLHASEDEFVEFTPEDIIQTARQMKRRPHAL